MTDEIETFVCWYADRDHGLEPIMIDARGPGNAAALFVMRHRALGVEVRNDWRTIGVMVARRDTGAAFHVDVGIKAELDVIELTDLTTEPQEGDA